MRALVAFDLDGVLYSSEPFLGDAYREAIALVNTQRPGAFPRTPETREILDHVGWPLAVIFARLFPTTDPAAMRLLASATQETICARVARREGVLFPGVAAVVTHLQRAGLTLAVASNGRRRYVETVLSTYAITRYFTPLVAAGDDEGIKSKGDILRAYLRREDALPHRLVMVGDRSSDVEAAQAVGCHFVGCDYGHGYRDEIEGAGPRVESLDALPAIITSLLSI